MAVNMYQIGVGGLLTAQKQLAVTGNNIANVNTDGYSRQRADQVTTNPDRIGGLYYGSGAQVNDVTRLYNQFAAREQVSNQSSYSYAQALSVNLDNLDVAMSNQNKVFAQNINGFYTTLNSIADTPNELGLRQIMLDQARILSDQFNGMQSDFDQIHKSVTGEIEESAKRISDLAQEIAALNSEMLTNKGTASVAGQPNDLMDQRDQLVNELAKFVNVSTVEDNNRLLTVMIGEGTTLVSGTEALSMTVVPGDPDPKQTEVALVTRTGQSHVGTGKLGGSLGALFQYRDHELKIANSEVNRLAIAFSQTMNDMQAQGLDLNGLQGSPIFSDINSAALQASRVMAYDNNTGNLQGGVNIIADDLASLTTDEYRISFDGVNYSMENMTDNSVTVLGAPGTGPFVTNAGFEFIENGGAPAAGDQFLIRPGQNAAASMQVILNQPAGVAASSAVDVTPSEYNISAGKVEVTNVADPVAARALAPLTVNVLETAPGVFQYDVLDGAGASIMGGPQAYTPPGITVDLPPLPAAPVMTIDITGTPSGLAPNAPEQYVINDAFGEGNGTNALNMALTQQAQIINGGRETFTSASANASSKVGSQAASIEVIRESSRVMFEQAQRRVQETSGVNLDEEAANMLQYQQAYQAASQIISVANTLFDTLMQSL